MFKKYLAAVALATLLAACGGGTESTQTASASPQAVASAMRAGPRLLSPMAASATDAANQLMDAAEAAYPQYFPSHQPTQSFAPFAFRYYPQTGIYLGVVVTASSFYTLNGVYAAGAPFGSLDNPTLIGLVTDFITPGGGTGGGTANGCFDLALFDTQGTHLQVAYSYSGQITGTHTMDTTVGGLTTFEGYQARETITLMSSTHDGMSSTSTNKSYGFRTGDAEVTHYGSVMTSSATMPGMTYNSIIRTVMTPPYTDPQYSLAVGASVTSTHSGVSTTTTSMTGQPDQTFSSPFTSSMTTKYVGQESVTVPAGTFNTCKFEVTTPGSTDVSTSWFVAGKGIHLKSSYPGMAMEATSVRLNGAPL